MSKTLDIFLWVLSHKHELFGIEDFKLLLCVSKKFQILLSSHAESFIVGLAKRALTTGEKIPRYWFKHLVYPRLKQSLTEDQRHVILSMLTETKNLIKNAACSQGKKFWTFSTEEGWSVENYDHPVPVIRRTQRAFCGSYYDCEVEQDVDLHELAPVIKANDGKVVLEAGAYVERRSDCGCTASVRLVLYDSDRRQLAEKSRDVKNEELPIPSGQRPCTYKLVLLRIVDPKLVAGAYKAKLWLWTKDTQCWSGHYAARFTDMFVRVVPIQYFSRPPA